MPLPACSWQLRASLFLIFRSISPCNNKLSLYRTSPRTKRLSCSDPEGRGEIVCPTLQPSACYCEECYIFRGIIRFRFFVCGRTFKNIRGVWSLLLCSYVCITYICVYRRVCIYVCIMYVLCVGMYVCMYVYVYMYICMYIFIYVCALVPIS